MSRGNIVSIVNLGEAAEIAGGILGEIAEPIGGGLIGEEIGQEVGDLAAGIVVTFQLRSGGTRSYRYDGEAAAAVLAGSDPSNYAGEPV